MGPLTDTTKVIETFGVAPVPLSERVMGPGMLFVIWALASASATTPIIGLLLKGTSVGHFSALVLMATVVGLWPSIIMSDMGRSSAVISLVTARQTFGSRGAGVMAVLYTLVGAGWFGLNTAVGANIITALFPGSSVLGLLALGVAQTVLVLFGMPVLEKFYKYTAPIFILCYGILTYYLFARFPFSWPSQAGAMPWGADIDLILSFSLLAWAYDFPTVTRFCTPMTASESFGTKWRYRIAAPAGVMSAVLIMGILGLFSLELAGLWNPALLARALPFGGEVAALGVIFAIAHTNAMNLYPAVTKLLLVFDSVGLRPHRLQQPLAVAALGVFSIYLAYEGILGQVQSLLSALGSFLFPFTFILATDYALSRPSEHGRPDIAATCGRCRTLASASLILGWGLGEMPHPSLGSVTRFVPWQLLTAIFVACLYGTGRWITTQAKSPKTLAHSIERKRDDAI